MISGLFFQIPKIPLKWGFALAAWVSVLVLVSCSSSFTALPANGVIQVSWTANKETMVNRSGGGYRVYYWRADTGSGDQAAYVDVPYVSGATAPTSASLDQLVAGKYFVKVAAFGTLTSGEFVIGGATQPLSFEITDSENENPSSSSKKTRAIVRQAIPEKPVSPFSPNQPKKRIYDLSRADHHREQILVRFDPDLSEGERLALVKKIGGKRLKSMPNHGESEAQGYFLVFLRPGVTPEVALQLAFQERAITHSQPVAIFKKLALPNDTLFAQQWALRNLGQTVVSPGFSDANATNNPGKSGADANFDSAWDVTTDCTSVKIAILDTGIRATHSDLADNLLPGFTVDASGTVTAGAVTYDDHGTQVASLIGAKGNNSSGMAGACWSARLIPIRVFDDSGTASEATMAAAVNKAVSEGAKIINLSLGGSIQYQAFADALQAAANSGVIIITAAGNSGTDNDQSAMYPCNYSHSHLLCIAALDQNNSLASFSNYGVSKVHMAAPGANIIGAVLGTRAYQTVSLTSGWTMSPASTWGYLTDSSASGAPVLTNPATWNGSTILYEHNADHRIYRTFDFTSVDDIVMNFLARYAIDASDGLYSALAEGSVDPFATALDADPLNGTSSGSYFPLSLSLRDCARKNCSLGFKFKSDASLRNTGVAIADVSLLTLTLNNTTYDIGSGTSFAAPLATGAAALVWSANPEYTAAQVVTALKESGLTLSALAGKVSTGKAIDAGAAVRYLEVPSGLTLE